MGSLHIFFCPSAFEEIKILVFKNRFEGSCKVHFNRDELKQLIDSFVYDVF